jgi:hypothetical protein
MDKNIRSSESAQARKEGSLCLITSLSLTILVNQRPLLMSNVETRPLHSLKIKKLKLFLFLYTVSWLINPKKMSFLILLRTPRPKKINKGG